MKTLKSLELGSFTLSTNDPVQRRRLKVVDRLEQQKALVSDCRHFSTAQHFNPPTHCETRKTKPVSRRL